MPSGSAPMPFFGACDARGAALSPGALACGAAGELVAVADAASQSDEPGGAAGEGGGMSAAEAEAILAKHFVIDQLKGRQ